MYIDILFSCLIWRPDNNLNKSIIVILNFPSISLEKILTKGIQFDGL